VIRRLERTGKLCKDAAVVTKFVWTHPANERRRLLALVRAARFQARARLCHRRTLARLGRQSYIWADLHRTAASKVVYANPPDYAEMQVWMSALHPGDLFLDVGANIGCYAILAGEAGANVIAFEPAEDTFNLLLENVRLNGYPIQALSVAVGASCGMARFTRGRDSANRLDPKGEVESKVVTIDSIIGDRVVAGMKIDVEGFEIDVLQGCERALADQRIGLIQLEWNSTSWTHSGFDRRPVAELLAKYHYKLYRPGLEGKLALVTDASFGADIFAKANPNGTD
jgi:FkbM family methyltransferase